MVACAGVDTTGWEHEIGPCGGVKLPDLLGSGCLLLVLLFEHREHALIALYFAPG